MRGGNTSAQDDCWGGPRGPLHHGERREKGGYGGVNIRAGGEETVHIITLYSGTERERQSKGAITMKSKGGERGDVVRFKKKPCYSHGGGGGRA